MLDSATKRRIDDCRDILVGKLPDPKAQIEQITIGLIYKFMDDMDKEAVEMGGKAKFFSNYSIPDPKDVDKLLIIKFEKYSWDNLFDAKVTATEMLTLYAEAIAGMDKNPNIPQLFRDIFKNAYLPYRDPETLKMFLKTINEFEYSHSEKLGDAFEYLLSVMGSQGDAGQFRTPRHIIDFLVAAVNPGKTDTVLDPACGTAGFLISAFKHIKEQNKNELTPDERKKLIQNFTGYDISPDMVRLSLVNLYLHGFSDPHISEYDTLSSEERWNESFDVILANPPFMSPKGGIRPHKKFSIASNRSEVLFVDYIAEHLNPKGRAGIIVPEGVIFQSGTAYKDLRKMLVDNYLYAVVSLPAGIFNPYSGVKTSILLMDKELSKTRDEILFVKVDNDGFNLGAQRNAVKGGQLKQAIDIIKHYKAGTFEASDIAHAVSKLVIAEKGDYNLSGERYKSTIISNSNYDMVALSYENIFKVVSGGTPSSEIEDYWNGNINWATLTDLPQKEFISTIYNTSRKITESGLKNSSAKLLPINSILVSTRATIGRIAIIKNECSTNQGFKNIIINDFQKANTYFVALMMTQLIDKMNSMATGGTFKELSTSSFRTLEIPLPPLSVQEEIVAEIESYQKIIDGAKMVVENYKPKIDIDPEWEMVELQSISTKIGDGLHGTPEYSNEGDYLFVNGNNLLDNKIAIKSETKKVTQEEYLKYKKDLTDRTIFVSINGTLGNVALYNGEKIVLGKSICYINLKKNVDKDYVKIYLQSANFIDYAQRMATGSTIQNVSLQTMRAFNIPIPSSDIQRQIVARIENEQSLVNANKELIAIFEQKIKDRIGKVWGTAPNPLPIKIGINSGDFESADKEMLMAAEPEVEYRKK